MKRAKRNQSKRAFKLGFNQGVKGHAKENCPFESAEKRGQWMGGWREGHSYYVSGFRSEYYQ